MTDYKMNASFEMLGAFWKYDNPGEKFTGTLSARKGSVTLVTAPTYTEGESAREAMHARMLAFNSRKPLPRVASICGYVKDGDCTLLASVQLDGGSTSNFSTGRSVDAVRYCPEAAIMGLHLESVTTPVVDSASFYFTKVNEYLSPAWDVNYGEDATTFVAPREAREVFRFSSVPLRCEVICETFVVGGNSRTKARIKSVNRIKIIPERPQSLDWFHELAFRTENFFTLCFGTSVAIKRFLVSCGDKTGWVVQRVRRRSEKVNFAARVKCWDNRFAIAFASWLAVPEERRPVELTVLGMLRKSRVFLETEFLSLAQALEGFNRIQGGPSKKFVKRVEETYDQLSPDFALKVVGERSDFAAKVVATRDYFTHLGLPETKNVVRRSTPLFLLNQRLHALLRCVMLLQHSISEDELRDAILYQATRWG